MGKSVGAQDWSQWRGPTRDGVVPTASVPGNWPDSLRRAWRVEIGEGFSSPVVSHGRIFVHSRRDPDEVVMAIDAANGRVVWEQHYTATLTDSSIVGLDTKTGGQLWFVPFLDDWHENIVTPVWTGSHLIISGVRQGTHAFTLQQSNSKWQAAEVWKNAEVAMYMSSPVYGDGLIYGHSARQKGQFVALDAKTGAIRWASEGREGNHASVLLTSRHLIYLTSGADLIVTRRNTAKFEIERRYDVAEAETWAMPVFLGADIFVRDATGLIRLTSMKQK